MTRPFPLKFMLPSPAKMLRVERVDYPYVTITGIVTETHSEIIAKGTSKAHWRLWLTANGDFTLGTFIQLCDNGTVNRITWHPDGTETIFEVKE